MAIKVIQEVGRPLKALVPLRNWAVDVAQFVEDWLIANNRIASRKSINSIEVVVTKPNEVELRGAPSLKYALTGRKAGKFPNVDAIKEWIKVKPIQLVDITLNSLAFLIGRKIARSGTSEPKLRPQNIQLVINQKAKKHLDDVGTIMAQTASAAMVELLTKNIPNTTAK